MFDSLESNRKSRDQPYFTSTYMNWDSLPRNWHAEIACATLNEDICKDGRDPAAGRYFPRLNEEYPLESYHPGECGKYTAVEFVGGTMMLAYLAALFASCIAV